MFQNLKPVGGMLMAALLMMGMFSRASFMAAAATVTVTREMINNKRAHCTLYVNGEVHPLEEGRYENAMLMVTEEYRTEPLHNRLGDVSSSEQTHTALYVDAGEQGEEKC